VARKKSKPKSSYHLLKQKWLKRHKQARKELHTKHKEAIDWLIEKFPAKEKLASGAVGLLMMSSVIPTSTVLAAVTEGQKAEVAAQVDRTGELNAELAQVVPDNVRPLSVDEETKLSGILSNYFNMDVKPDIGGLRLNRTYGLIGAEQHLVRYPGDTLSQQIDLNSENAKLFWASGMAPGRGAWGYFAGSKAEFNDLASEQEKWYIAVQTFAAVNYNQRLSDYRDFFKFRKMLVVNTKTGQAVVCDIGDSGPAIWTGKHLGGSPEVMYSLGLADGPRKGPVLYFFIDDASDKIPLGPVKPMGLPTSANEKN
jgi:hypothetical protein